MAGMASRRRSGHGRLGRRRGAFSQALHPRQRPPIVSALIRGPGTLRLGLALAVVGGLCSMPAMANVSPRAVVVGAEVLLAGGFAGLAGKRVGLIANQTSLVNGSHLADLLKAAPGVTLAAILAPEHGFRGASEAGASVGHTIDEKTGVPVW